MQFNEVRRVAAHIDSPMLYQTAFSLHVKKIRERQPHRRIIERLKHKTICEFTASIFILQGVHCARVRRRRLLSVWESNYKCRQHEYASNASSPHGVWQTGRPVRAGYDKRKVGGRGQEENIGASAIVDDLTHREKTPVLKQRSRYK